MAAVAPVKINTLNRHYAHADPLYMDTCHCRAYRAVGDGRKTLGYYFKDAFDVFITLCIGYSQSMLTHILSSIMPFLQIINIDRLILMTKIQFANHRI